jgi:hypothetical protein
MFPSRDQIERAAYERWERRGRFHGADRDDWSAAEIDLTFALNYETIVEFALDESERRVIGSERRPRCRFCEQSAPRASFSFVRRALPEVVGNASLYTREICDECANRFDGTINKDLAKFWESLHDLRDARASFRELRAPTGVSIAAFKALIRMAISIMPEEELTYFTDTIEWVSNPNHEFDSFLLGDPRCLICQTHVPYPMGWTSLCMRKDVEAPFPYMLFFLASGRLALQTQLPLCTQDEDLDGTQIRLPERTFSTGVGSDLRPPTCMVLPLRSSANSSSRRFRLFW